MFNPNSSVLAGMDRASLQAALNTAQQVYLELSSGAKGVSFSYAQGDGTRSVTYSQADISGLLALIQTLQAQLGIVPRPRRAIRFRF